MYEEGEELGGPAPYRVFISHGSADAWIAGRIREALKAIEINAFLDSADIVVGDDFRKAILTQLETCDEVLVLLTPTSINRAWVFAEIGAAVVMQKRVVGIRYALDVKELHDRGVVSLIGDVAISVLDDPDLKAYLEAVRRRADAKGKDNA